jgi:hypothetical protein
MIHELVDDELAASLEQVEQARVALRAIEDVVLFSFTMLLEVLIQ